MADENETSTVVDGADATVAAAAKTPEPKKQRVPRQKKVAAEVVAPEPAVAVKSPRVPRKKLAEKAAAAPAADTVAVAGDAKPGRGRKGVAKFKAPKAAAAAPAGPSDEFADLLALEEENKTLRKALSEKLKAENADLRKKLGQA